MPIIIALGEWGFCWARKTLATDYLDVDMLLLYLERSVDPAQLPGRETVIQFKFNDLPEQRDWWLLVRDDKVDVCISAPGRDVDVFFSTTARTMSEVWMGERTLSRGGARWGFDRRGGPGADAANQLMATAEHLRGIEAFSGSGVA